MHTSSDIRNPIVEANIPCVGLGCLGGNLSQNNKVDEWIDIEDFSLMVEVTSEIIERCSGEQKEAEWSLNVFKNFNRKRTDK